jgi:hypothetical protein
MYVSELGVSSDLYVIMRFNDRAVWRVLPFSYEPVCDRYGLHFISQKAFVPLFITRVNIMCKPISFTLL